MFLPPVRTVRNLTDYSQKKCPFLSDLRLPQRFRNTGLDCVDLSRSEPSEGPLVLGTTETRSHGPLEVGNGGTDGGSALARQRLGGHDCS